MNFISNLLFEQKTPGFQIFKLNVIPVFCVRSSFSTKLVFLMRCLATSIITKRLRSIELTGFVTCLHVFSVFRLITLCNMLSVCVLQCAATNFGGSVSCYLRYQYLSISSQAVGFAFSCLSTILLV